MKKLSLLMLFVLLTAQEAFSTPTKCQLVPTIFNKVRVLREWPNSKSVPCVVQEKPAVETFIRETIKKKIKPGRLEADGLIAKILGVIPEEYDYEEGMIALYLGALGGYYDPEQKRFVMAGWMPDLVQETIAAHELTHAMQDQTIALSTLLDNAIENSDMLLARSSVIEGDATWVMYEYMNQQKNMPSLRTMPNVDAYLLQSTVGAMAQMSSSPKGLVLSMIFPYTSGLRFAHAAIQKGGFPELNKVLQHPPTSTEEILHPEKYFAQKNEYRRIEDSEFVVNQDEELLFRDTMGEFGITVAIGQMLDGNRGVAAGAGWGGDRAQLTRNTKNKDVTLSWITEWDTEKDREEFVAALAEGSKKRFGKEISTEAGTLSPHYSGHFVLSDKKVVVYLVRKAI